MNPLMVILILLLCLGQTSNLVLCGNIPSITRQLNTSQTPDDRQRFQTIYSKLIDSAEVISLAEIRDLVSEAEQLSRAWVSAEASRIAALEWLAVSGECDFESLVNRHTLHNELGEHPTVGPYVNFHISVAIELCTIKLEPELSSLHQLSDFPNLRQLWDELMDQQPNPNEPQISEELLMKTTISLLESSSQLDLAKPMGVPMVQQMEVVDNYFDQLLWRGECGLLPEDFISDALNRFEILYDMEPEVAKIFSDESLTLLERIELCDGLKHVRPHLLPLGKYDFFQLDDWLHGNQEYEPEQTQNYLEIFLFVGQARLALYGELDSELMRSSIELLKASRVHRTGCDLEQLRWRTSLSQLHENHPNLIRYLEYYGQQQLTLCLPRLNRDVASKVGRFPRDGMNEINSLRRHLLDLQSDEQNLASLAYHIEPDSLQLAIDDYLRAKMGNPRDFAGLQQVARQVDQEARLLLRVCNRIAADLVNAKLFFDQLARLDTGSETMFSKITLNWLTNYNICHFILENPIQ